MKVIWTLIKVMIALAVVIPISIIVLATALGILGALIGIAILALKVAVCALVGWAAFRLIVRLVGGGSLKAQHGARVSELPPVDPHYEAAMRELDRELGEAQR